jgi:transcription elongation GreA/GreB family factor
MAPEKAEILAALIEAVEEDLQALTDSQLETQSGATHEEARPESDKDTRATESSYLARGLARRVVELREALSLLRSLRLRTFGEDAMVALSALVTLEDEDGNQERYFLVPSSGGIKLRGAAGPVVSVTPDAPLGRALLGRRLDDEVTFRRAGAVRERTICAIE